MEYWQWAIHNVWPEDIRVEYDERAGVYQYEGGLDELEAGRRAFDDIYIKYGPLQTSVKSSH